MSEFVDAVAARAGVTADTVANILAAHEIREYLPAAPAARLRVQRITFSGTKRLMHGSTGESFEFGWDVPDGVSGLASTGNSAGKTSVIEMVRWLLTGRSHVDKWVFERVRLAALEFTIDGQAFAVEVERDPAGLSGLLSAGDAVLRTFDQAGFEGVMDELLLARLGLDRIPVFSRRPGSSRGRVDESGWPLLADALHVRPSELSTVIGGVAVRANQMLQVYLALPWYDTLLQVRAAAAMAQQAAGDAEQALLAQDRVRQDETAHFREELARAKVALAAMHDEQAVSDQLQDLVRRAAVLAEADLKAGSRVLLAQVDLAAAEDAQLEARRALHNLVEREAAGAFFRALEPRACPRCATPIDEARKAQETAHHVCSVCNRAAEHEPDPTAQARAEQQVISTGDAVGSAMSALAEVEAEQREIAAQRAALNEDIARLTDSQAMARRRDQEALVYRLEGRIAERDDTRQRLQLGTVGRDDTVRVLRAAEAEAAERVRQSTALFDELNEEILALGQRFGISGLTKVKLDRGARLPVTKEGTNYNFGDLSDGDKLRLKVALVIALLRVGRRRSAGRHPGLLFVDSPGAEEVVTDSLTQMVTGLVEVADELDLQVVVATARLRDVQAVLTAEHLRVPAEGQSTLW